MSFHSCKKVKKAAKKHTCEICYGSILAGDGYYKNAGKHDYGFYDYKVCERCEELLNSAIKDCLVDDDNCLSEDTLVECLIMGDFIICPHCNKINIYNYFYKDPRRLNVEFVCEYCEKHWEQAIDLKTLEGD